MKTHTIFFVLLYMFIFYSANVQGQWIPVSKGTAYSFAADDKYIYAGLSYFQDSTAQYRILRSSDMGVNWENISNGILSTVYSLVVKDSLLFAGVLNSIFVSSDNGDNWKQTSFSTTGAVVRSLIVIDSAIFAGTAGREGDIDTLGGVFCSTDDGKTWISKNNGLMMSNGARGRITSFATIDTDLFTGALMQGIFHSSDKGESWNHLWSNGTVNTLAVIDSALFAGFDLGAVFRSIDKGITWTHCDSGLADSINKDFTILSLAVSGKNLFAGTMFHGVYASYDLGESWVAVNSGLTMKPGDVCSIFVNEPYIFISTNKDTIWRRTLAEMITNVENSLPNNPYAFLLEQNFPNPFNGATVIRYKLANNGFVTLKLYDILGREVEILVNESKNAGDYSMNFNANQLSSGVYLYRLTVNEMSIVKKMILLQ